MDQEEVEPGILERLRAHQDSSRQLLGLLKLIPRVRKPPRIPMFQESFLALLEHFGYIATAVLI
ncbi:unnamed protein product [Periconia digitata]|uniref:Uncharacterized protein n=1 Tax=Periconia digitata TaxID=1303443 RepID=A0A9W4XGZ1_9PLEO|nr:unnamed protein product [Periconia digitata]